MAFDNENSPKERLQKVLAHAGIASRRNAEMLILEGAVTVNGKVVTELGTRVNPINDKIKVNGKLIQTDVKNIYIVFYKPKGMISALSDPEGRPSLAEVTDAFPARVTPIGRMDFNSEGMLLLTNDGTMGERILKTRDLVKTYLVKVKGHPTDQDLEFLKKGFFTEEGTVRFSNYKLDQRLKNKSWLKLEVSEGSQLDLRDLFNKKGLLVDRIVRTGIGQLSIGDMEPGDFRLVTPADFERSLVAPIVEEAKPMRPRTFMKRESFGGGGTRERKVERERGGFDRDRGTNRKRAGGPARGGRTERPCFGRPERSSFARTDERERPAKKEEDGYGRRRKSRFKQSEDKGVERDIPSARGPRSRTGGAGEERSGRGPRREGRPSERSSFGGRTERGGFGGGRDARGGSRSGAGPRRGGGGGGAKKAFRSR
jgi:23S rRNA pseudouridine2605 synthase